MKSERKLIKEVDYDENEKIFEVTLRDNRR